MGCCQLYHGVWLYLRFFWIYAFDWVMEQVTGMPESKADCWVSLCWDKLVLWVGRCWVVVSYLAGFVHYIQIRISYVGWQTYPVTWQRCQKIFIWLVGLAVVCSAEMVWMGQACCFRRFWANRTSQLIVLYHQDLLAQGLDVCSAVGISQHFKPSNPKAASAENYLNLLVW